MSFNTVTKPQKKKSTVTIASAAGYFSLPPAAAVPCELLVFTIAIFVAFHFPASSRHLSCPSSHALRPYQILTPFFVHSDGWWQKACSIVILFTKTHSIHENLILLPLPGSLLPATLLAGYLPSLGAGILLRCQLAGTPLALPLLRSLPGQKKAAPNGRLDLEIAGVRRGKSPPLFSLPRAPVPLPAHPALHRAGRR